MDSNNIFLTEEQVDELTGIGQGKTIHPHTKLSKKVTKYELQITHLRENGIAIFINARGRPIVTRAAIEGRKEEIPVQSSWQPRLALSA